MTLRELMETNWDLNNQTPSCKKGVKFAQRYDYDVRKMLTNKARKDYGHWDGPPAWCLLWTLRNVGRHIGLIDAKSTDAMIACGLNRAYTVAEQREQYREIARLMKIRGITHRTHNRPRREPSFSFTQPRLF